MEQITQKYLKEALTYYPLTGLFFWLERPVWHFTGIEQTDEHVCKTWNGNFAGKQAGSLDTKGYIVIPINNKRYKAHRLAFLYMEGYIPENDVDHIKTGFEHRSNNKWDNLREASRMCNAQNRCISPRNTSGVTGVCWYPQRSRWTARLGKKFLGYHKDKVNAVKARYREERMNPLWSCSTDSSARNYLINNKLIFQNKRTK